MTDPTVIDPRSGRPLFHVQNTDVMTGLRTLPDNSVHCVFTSPPYWKVRDYGVAGQLGQEATLEEHIANLVAVFREVRRVLHPSGTLWVNYGDVSAQNGRQITDEEAERNNQRAYERSYTSSNFSKRQWMRACGTAAGAGLAEKHMLLLPERLALAMQTDGWDLTARPRKTGWWLRSQIVWRKVGANSESIKDRPSREHEMIYLFSKSERYFYNIYAVRRNMRIDADKWIFGSQLRTVWDVPKGKSRNGHPAVFHPELPRRGLLLGSSHLGCCPECLSPVKPIYEKRDEPDLEAQRRCGGDKNGEYHSRGKHGPRVDKQDPGELKANTLKSMRPVREIGARTTCKCLHSVEHAIPCRVLDPFAGEGNTLMAALFNGRFASGIELNPRDVAFQNQDLKPLALQWAEMRRNA